MNREYWLQNKNLTSKDLSMLLQNIHKHLLDYESWYLDQAYWNDRPLKFFLYHSLEQMLDIIEKDLGPSENIENYYSDIYPKIKQLWDYEDVIELTKKNMTEVMKDLNLTSVYEVIERWWNFRIEELSWN